MELYITLRNGRIWYHKKGQFILYWYSKYKFNENHQSFCSISLDDSQNLYGRHGLPQRTQIRKMWLAEF